LPASVTFSTRAAKIAPLATAHRQGDDRGQTPAVHRPAERPW